MSVLDNVTSFVHNAVYGTLSDSQVANIQAKVSADIAKASAGADPAVVAERQRQAVAEVTKSIAANNALPSQSTFFGSSGFGNLTQQTRKIVLVGVAVFAVLFFIQLAPILLPRRR